MLASSFASQATHIIGGDLSYVCLGDKSYQFTLTIYSECGSQAVLENFYPIHYFSVSQNISQSAPLSFIVNKVSEQEVIVFCSTVTTNCNGGIARGIRKVIYTGTVTLNSLATDWNFYWKRAARSEEITTLLLPDEEDFFIKVEMNNVDAPCNNSPTFENNPVITACIGKKKVFNHIAVDPDGDRLEYSLASPQSDLDVNVVYNTGYSYNKFVTMSGSATINSSTGDISFTPSNKEQVGITDVVVKEYRNNILIGTSVRGMQITTLDCSNNPPTLSSFKDINKDSIAVCAGELINLKIDAKDPDGQNVTLTNLKGVSGVFSVTNDNTTNPVGNFSWSTTIADVGKHYFTIEAKDDGCPEPQIATRTFVVVVLSLPTFTLGPDQVVKCGTSVKLDPQIIGGDGKYKYLWSNGKTTSSVTVPIGSYSLTVTDGKGCSYTDDIILDGGVFPSFEVNPRCLGQASKFNDLSSSVNGVINSWAWKFGDGATSTAQNPSHTYTKAGEFEVDLTIKTDKNCTVNLKKKIKICAIPVANFDNLDSCTNELNPVRFVDLTPTSTDCEVIKREWTWGDGTSSVFEAPLSSTETHIYELPGEKEVTLKVTTISGCTSTFTKKINIHKSPEINILQDSYIYKCSTPPADTTLVTEIIYPGTGALKYQWSDGKTTPDNTITGFGYYEVWVVDENGGKAYDYLYITYPLYSSFTFTPLCHPDDTIHFTSDERNNTGNPLSYEWNFGDGSPVSTEKDPSHKFTSFGVYNVSLKVKDEIDGCENINTFPVQNTYLKDTFGVFPKHISICVRNVVTGFGPEIDSVSGSLINSYEWDFGNGDKQYTQQATTEYLTTGQFVVKLKVIYNHQPGFNSGCVKEYQDVITVYPEFKVDFDAFRVCINDPVQLSFRRTTGDLSIGIKNASWQIKNKATGETDILNEIKPIYTFKERQQFEVTLTAQDSIGCEYSITKDFQVDEVADPDFTFNTVCANELTNLIADFRDSYENISNVFWDFGNNDTITTFYNRPNSITKEFGKGGSFPVTLKVYNSATGCFKSITKYVDVKDVPEVKFEADTVCANQSMSFINQTTIASGEVKSWLWQFPDGSTSDQKNPQHVFTTGGVYKVSLRATSETCSAIIEKEVLVKDIPVADFSIEEDLLEAYKPLHFKDNSQGDIITHFWNFGDGITSSEKDPIHQYDTVKVYNVTHIVFNSVGCSDTIVKRTNLNVRLDLPTAFTPNFDGTNDGLSLIHYGIKELYEFKIYNRWGELVFDAGNNLNAVWDGSFKGKKQEVGSYVAYVKALGIYDTQFSFKKNISILK